MKRAFKLRFGAVFFASTFFVVGCSSGANEEELAQLEALKAELGSILKEISTVQAEKASLSKQIADKQAELAAAMKEQDATRERLRSQP